MKTKFEKLLKGIFLTSIVSLVSSNDAMLYLMTFLK